MSTASDRAPAGDVQSRNAPAPRGIRQTMSELHTWAGLLAGWLLFAMFLTGTVSFFKEELSQWMRPELAHHSATPDPALAAARVAATLGSVAAGSPQWGLELPNARNPVVNVFWRTPAGKPGQRGFEEATFDARTGQPVAARDTEGGHFFYRFHFQFHYLPVQWGRWLAGICAMCMLVAIISGVITHKKIFIDFFTFRWGKGQRSWLDAHNALSVFGLPFHLMITYTGLVTLMAMYMPWGERAALQTPAQRQQLSAQLSAFLPPGKASGEPVALASLEPMVRQAQARWGRDNVSRVTVNHPGDAAARVIVQRGEAGRVSMSPQYMVFSGATGALLSQRDQVGPAAEVRGVLYALHLGRFSDLSLRWLYFLVSLAGTAMVGTGLVMWTVKRRQKLSDPERPHFGFRLVERLNIATIAGLSVAMTAMLWGNRLLPAALPARADWEIHLFFGAWAATLGYALLRPARRAWIELLWLAAGMLALLPVLNALTTERPLWRSVAQGDWVYVGVELMLWGFAALHALLASRTAAHHGPYRSPRRTPGGGPTDRSALAPAYKERP